MARKIKKPVFLYTVLLLFHISLTTASWAQLDTWVAANSGLPDSKQCVVERIVSVKGIAIAVINKNADGAKNGLYKFDKNSNTWAKFSNAQQYGFGEILSSGTRLIAYYQTAIYEIDLNTGQWNKQLDINNYKVSSTYPNAVSFGECDAVGDKVYGLRGSEQLGFWVMEYDLATKQVKELKNPNKAEFPLPPDNTNRMNSIVGLANGKVYVSYVWKYRDSDQSPAYDGIWRGTHGAVYEWDGTDWKDVTAGLDLRNRLRNGWGPFGAIIASTDKKDLHCSTEQGTFKKAEGGWFQTSAFIAGAPSLYATGVYICMGLNRIEKALTMQLGSAPAEFYSCAYDSYRNLCSPDEGQTFLVNWQHIEGSCQGGANATNYGIYRLQVDPNKPQKVRNLHLETATYVGGKGTNDAIAVEFGKDNKIYAAGNYTANNLVTTNTINIAQTGGGSSSKGKIYKFNENGTQLEAVINIGNAIYDMDISPTTGEIAIIGDFGVLVLNANGTFKWLASEATTTTSRISIADNGKVAAVIKSASNGPGRVRIWSATGTIEGTNTSRDNNGMHITDLEISSHATHNKVYITGFTQATSDLQIAYLDAYDINNISNRVWFTWSFGATTEVKANGADTRAYRVKTTTDKVFVLGESAGGGPGGFTIFAYNGKDVTTKTAIAGDDYNNGTNSCGSCHITYLAQISPTDGTVEKGIFIHGRRSDGKTNTHKVNNGYLEADEQGYLYIGATAASYIEGRDAFHINGKLVGEYAGDMVCLVLAPNLQTRVMWATFNKNKGAGDAKSIAIGNGKVALFGTNNKGTMMTTDNALQKTPFNLNADTLTANEAYLALWQREVWLTANKDTLQERFISAASINLKNAAENGFFFYPNPMTNESQLYCNVKGTTQVNIKIINSQGKEVANIEVPQIKQGENIKIPRGNLQPGTYLCVLFFNGEKQTIRFLVSQ